MCMQIRGYIVHAKLSTFWTRNAQYQTHLAQRGRHGAEAEHRPVARRHGRVDLLRYRQMQLVDLFNLCRTSQLYRAHQTTIAYPGMSTCCWEMMPDSASSYSSVRSLPSSSGPRRKLRSAKEKALVSAAIL